MFLKHLRLCIFGTVSPCQCIFLSCQELGSGFLFYPCSRLSQNPAVLDLTTKSSKRDVSLGGCSLNQSPFLMLLKGSTRFNKAKNFNINQVSVKTLPWVLLLTISRGVLWERVQEGCRWPDLIVVSASRKSDWWVINSWIIPKCQSGFLFSFYFVSRWKFGNFCSHRTNRTLTKVF